MQIKVCGAQHTDCLRLRSASNNWGYCLAASKFDRLESSWTPLLLHFFEADIFLLKGHTCAHLQFRYPLSPLTGLDPKRPMHVSFC